MPRTRILATLGPASRESSTIRELLEAGADAFRLNFSHGTAAEHAEVLSRVREISAAAGRHIAVLQDLGGPKIRTGRVSRPLPLVEGQSLSIELGDFDGEPDRISCSFDALFTSVHAGHRLLMADGRLELEVTSAAPGQLMTRVVTGGVLDSHKGINVPDVSIRTSALTPKDLEDLRAGVAMGVDLVALSFVQSADDMRAARAAVASLGAPDLPLVAKIEKPQAVEHVEEILEVADALMVARGDLGIEVPLETLPAIQKRLIRAARRRAVPVIVATQVLESMMTEPRPTRAEVTDAAHAVEQGADGILLTGETAAGKYPVRAVATLRSIVNEAETVLERDDRLTPDPGVGSQHGRALCEAAVTLAEHARAAAIVAVTEAGKTARMLAALRPTASIVAATPSAQTAARASLVWGIRPMVIDSTDLATVRQALLTRGLVPSGATVVFVSIHPMLGREGTNFVHVERL
jgi:pyruvate kinase